MIELAAISPFGGGGVNIRQHAEGTPLAVPAVEASLAGQGLNGGMSSGHSQNGGSGQQPAPQNWPQKPRVDPHALTGPPPAFQINLLEMHRDLAQALARMNAAHGFSRETAATPVDGGDRQPVQAAEASETPPDNVPVDQAKPETTAPKDHSAA